jgi:hypothetical protein
MPAGKKTFARMGRTCDLTSILRILIKHFSCYSSYQLGLFVKNAASMERESLEILIVERLGGRR